jgi:hypothetical protein
MRHLLRSVRSTWARRLRAAREYPAVLKVSTRYLRWRNQPIASRAALPFLLDQLGLMGVGAEVGVAEGAFSEFLLRHCRLSLLYSIDPWLEFPRADYEDVNNLNQTAQDERYLRVQQRLKAFGGRSTIVRATSVDASRAIPDASLDFVFIDANHMYEPVRTDIEAWWPKVKPGGLFSGHDYLTEVRPKHGTYEVKRAVDEFVREQGLHLFATRERWPTWYVFKPKA